MICTLVLPRAVDHAASRITPTVTVFTPPAVEPDEPPTSIRKSATAFDMSDSAFWSKVAKPAVRKRDRLEQRRHQLLRRSQAAKRAGIVPFQRGENSRAAEDQDCCDENDQSRIDAHAGKAAVVPDVAPRRRSQGRR